MPSRYGPYTIADYFDGTFGIHDVADVPVVIFQNGKVVYLRTNAVTAQSFADRLTNDDSQYVQLRESHYGNGPFIQQQFDRFVSLLSSGNPLTFQETSDFLQFLASIRQNF